MNGTNVIENCRGQGIWLVALIKGFKCTSEEFFGSREILFLVGKHSSRVECFPILGFG